MPRLSRPTTYLVRNGTELKDAYKSAADGDRIEIAAGAVISDFVRLKGEYFTKGLTITSQDPNKPGVFTGGLELFQTSNITITDVDFRADTFNSVDGLFMRVADNITLSRLDFEGFVPTAATGGINPSSPGAEGNDPLIGYGSGRGLRILDIDGLSVSDVSLNNYNVAIRIEDLFNATLTRLDLAGNRDGITFTDVDGLTISDSHFHDFKPWLTGNNSVQDHPDMIQYWGKNGTIGNHDVTIQGNVFEQYTDWTQTIYGEMRGAPAGITATNFNILDNVIINAHTNAIRVEGVNGALIQNNLLLNNGVPGSNFPRIDPSNTTNYTLTDNVLAENGVIGISDSQTEALGNVLLSQNSSDPDYWGVVLQAWKAGTIADLETSPIIGQLSAILASGGSAPAGAAALALSVDDSSWDASVASSPYIPAPVDPGTLDLLAGPYLF